MEKVMWRWRAQGVSAQTVVTVIEARGEAVAETVIDVTHAATGTLQTPKILADQEGISIAAVGVTVLLGQDHLTMTDTIDLVADLAVRMMIEPETEAPVVTAIMAESGHRAPSPSLLHHNQQRMNVIEERFLCSSLLLD